MRNLILVISACLIIFSGCKTPAVDEDAVRGQIFMNYTDWAESIALTHLASLLLEERLEYDVVLKLTNVDTAFMEVASGEADLFADAWMPYTHLSFLEKYKGEFEDLGPNYREARTGFVVPEYMEIESISEIKELYSKPVTGIDSSAGIMQNAFRAIESYDLENDLLVLSDAEMSERVENAIKRRENIVFTGWEPHWLFFRYELKYLDDPREVFQENEQIHTIGRNGFTEDHPQATIFFERMVLTENQINELLYEVLLSRDPAEGVQAWIDKNEIIVNQWVKGLRPEREKIM